MISLNKHVLISRLNKLSCFENNPSVAVAVSGGPDSMALVYIVNHWVKNNNGKLSALIFDHGLRENSNEEANEVKIFLKELKIKSHIIKAKKNNLIKRNMAQARINRFNGLINFCLKNNILHLFLGHHFDDNLETYLMRKINGSNLEGLGSMNILLCMERIQIIRPLIETNKRSIINFNKKNKIKFINDPSNEDYNYTRVQIRNFLQNKNYKKLAKLDFLKIKNQIPEYKKMIWELFIKNITKINNNKVEINFNRFIKSDNLIIEKHILILLKFFSNKNYQTKSQKIKILIEIMKKPEFKFFNLSGINIKKYEDILIFSQK